MIDTKQIFNIANTQEFEDLAFQVFKFQFENNSVYRSFCDLLYKHPSDLSKVEEIPFLPISFFKTHQVISSSKPVSKIFSSSGTTGSVVSKHYITNISIYEDSFKKCFEKYYGNLQDYTILALLPNYLEREGSSLVYMVNQFIKDSKQVASGFYLHNYTQLMNQLKQLDKAGKKVLLIGVSFALLDLIEQSNFSLNNTIIMETGGMKGKRKELIRAELHAKLKQGFGVQNIHSEYGMTELLSQAYSKADGVYSCPNWMRTFTRDPEDALTIQPAGKTGGLNIIDLANVNSCAFIATQDLGVVSANNTFEVLGRFDSSDIRGCNLMVL